MLSAKPLANTTEDTAAQSPPIKKGGANRRARGNKFKTKKNDSFQQGLNDSIRAKLKVNSLPPLGAISVYRGVKPQRFSLVLSGLYYPVAAMLSAVGVMGNHVLDRLLGDRYVRRVFIAFTYAFATVKVAYAQRASAANSIHFEPIHDIDQDRMETIACLASSLPKMVAMILDSIGIIPINQTLVPVFPNEVDGLSYSSVCRFVMSDHPDGDDAYRYWGVLKAVFEFTDEDITRQGGTLSCKEDLRSAWSMSRQACETFSKVIAAMRSVKGLLVPVNIRTGTGTAAQLVRFPTHEIAGTITWYANLNVSDDDIKSAALALTGYELGLEPLSFYETDLERCLVEGRVNRDTAIRAILLADTIE